MDGQRFDDLTRTLTHGASRRRVVRGLLGGALGALGATLGLRRAGAQGACSAYGRVCTYTGCCTTPGAECVCYQNGHCRCLCPDGAWPVNGACEPPPGTLGGQCGPGFAGGTECEGDTVACCATVASGQFLVGRCRETGTVGLCPAGETGIGR